MNIKELNIRKATESDYLAVDALYFETYNLYHKNIPDNYKKTPKPTLPRGTFINIIEDKNALMIVVEIKNKVVGMLYATIEKDKGNEWSMSYNRVSIDEISVFPKYASQGVGTKLMEEAEKWAKENKIKDMIVLVYDFNKSAISFYEKNSYLPYSIQMKKKI